MTEHEDFSDPDEFPITLGLFIKLLEAPVGDLEAVWEFGKAADEAIGVDGLLRGWDLVACFLLAALRDHARECDCGSLEWLKREQLRTAGAGSHG